MLVLEESTSLRLITQHDHARLAHDLLSLWVGDGLPGEALRDDLLLAAREHDSGWQGADSAPAIDPATGWPYDFRVLPDGERRRLWRDSVDRLAASRPQAALLIIRHAERLHRDRLPDDEWREFFHETCRLRQALESTNDIESARLDNLYEFLWLSDTLSLGGCGALAHRAMTWRRYELSLSPQKLVVQPFPYAGPLTLRVAFRLLPKRRYADTSDLATNLAQSRWQFMPIRVEPGR